MLIDHIKLDSHVPVSWDIDFLAKDYAAWITHSGSTTPTSKTGILCTKDFQRLASRTLKEPFCREFRILLWTSSLLHVLRLQGWHSYQLSLQDLEETRNNAATKVLSQLEERCRPETIRNLTDTERKALFLVIVGTVLSVTYTGTPQGPPIMENVSSRLSS
jgi:hypothetical protein